MRPYRATEAELEHGSGDGRPTARAPQRNTPEGNGTTQVCTQKHSARVAPQSHPPPHSPTVRDGAPDHQPHARARQETKARREGRRGRAQRRRLGLTDGDQAQRSSSGTETHKGSTNGGDGGKQQANPHSSGREIDTHSDRHRGGTAGRHAGRPPNNSRWTDQHGNTLERITHGRGDSNGDQQLKRRWTTLQLDHKSAPAP
jgi:hypothetical protein